MSKPIVLTILDGWGYRPETHGNAIAHARKPIYDALLRDYPNTLLRASEHFVGLPDGQMGNSEVGHLNLGAGRIVRMDMTRIDTAIVDGTFYTDPTLVRACELAAQKGRALHLIGLLSDGGVHSHQRHLYALLRMAAQHKLTRVFVHAFMDGRDTLPTSGLGYLEALQQQIPRSTASARSPQRQRPLLRHGPRPPLGKGTTGLRRHGHRPPRRRNLRRPHRPRQRTLQQRHHRRVHPTLHLHQPHEGHPIGLIRDHDVVINFNYRADRVRQITRVLTRRSGLTADPEGSQGLNLPKAAELDAAIPLSEIPANLHYVCMTQYDKNFKLPIVIPARVDGQPPRQPHGRKPTSATSA